MSTEQPDGTPAPMERDLGAPPTVDAEVSGGWRPLAERFEGCPKFLTFFRAPLPLKLLGVTAHSRILSDASIRSDWLF